MLLVHTYAWPDARPERLTMTTKRKNASPAPTIQPAPAALPMAADDDNDPAARVVAELQAASDKRVPFVWLMTADQPAAQSLCVQACAATEQGDPQIPCFALSAIRGLAPLNAAGETTIGQVMGGSDPSGMTTIDVIVNVLEACPVECMIAWWGAAQSWANPAVAVGLLMIRSALERGGITLVGLASGPAPSSDLQADILTIRDALPGDDERARIIDGLCRTSSVECNPPLVSRAANATRGLTRFAVAQVTSLATRRNVLDLDVVMARWREQLAGLPGVSVERPIPREYYGGNEGFVRMVEAYADARISLVIQLDECEKALPDLEARDAGVSRFIASKLLEYLNDSEPAGLIAEGVPGTGKSLGALLAAGMLQVPCIRIRPGEWKSGEVGSSEATTTRVLGMLRSFGGVQLWIATSNDLSVVPAEFTDRFPDGVVFFDVPDPASELPAICAANVRRYGFDPTTIQWPALAGYTGRDIRAICLKARRTGQPIEQVAAERVPAARRMAARIDRMRTAARTEAYLSAATGREYTGPVVDLTKPPAPRAIRTRGAAPSLPQPQPAAPAAEDTF